MYVTSGGCFHFENWLEERGVFTFTLCHVSEATTHERERLHIIAFVSCLRNVYAAAFHMDFSSVR